VTDDLIARIEALHAPGPIKPDALVVDGETIALHESGCPTCLTSYPCPTVRLIHGLGPNLAVAE
jgi:hypothetical protein